MGGWGWLYIFIVIEFKREVGGGVGAIKILKSALAKNFKGVCESLKSATRKKLTSL